jgi:ornithine cyclodeaminase/alanine dehydrogenase-like protein (mu-crystallin family)
MPLTILTDEDVRILLHSLTRKDILDLQQSLADALHYYSTAVEEEDNGCCASYQPQRTSLKRKDGSTTLFMPANSNEGMGVKIVTLSEVCPLKSLEASGRMNSMASSVSTSASSTSSPSNTTSNTASSASSAIETPSSATSLLSQSMASLSTSGPSTLSSKESTNTPFDSIADFRAPERAMKDAGTSPTGSLTLLESDGTPRALVNAAEITAFRTALAATMLFKKRANVHDVVIFGAGKQAYWHARIALLLRGDEIHHLNIVNRSFENAANLIHDLYKVPWPVKIPHPKPTIITPMHTEYQRYLKSTIRAASVIFCTTPSTEPLFPPEYLTSTEGRKKGRYVAAIGSYKPHMIELHPDIIRQAVAPSHKHHHHKHARQGGAIVVDSVEACLKEAGELIQAGLGGREVVELGELLMLKRDAENKRKESQSSLDSAGVELGGRKGSKEEDDGGLREWLEKGNVVYKSVGLGLMDIVVGGDLVKMADTLGLGTRIARF